MLKITVELVPNGDESQKQVVAIGEIWNAGTHANGYVGDYQYRFEANHQYKGIQTYAGELTNFYRVRRSALELVRECIAKAISPE